MSSRPRQYTHPADDPATAQKWRELWRMLLADPDEKKPAVATRADEERRDAATQSSR